MNITPRLAALFGSRRYDHLEDAARDAARIVRLARRMNKINIIVSCHPPDDSQKFAHLAHENDRLAAQIGTIAKRYLKTKVLREHFVFRNDPRGPAVRLVTPKLEADCIAGGTAIQ